MHRHDAKSSRRSSAEVAYRLSIRIRQPLAPSLPDACMPLTKASAYQADLVDDQQLRCRDHAMHHLFHPALPISRFHRDDEIGSRREAYLPTLLRRNQSERDREVRLAGAARTEQDPTRSLSRRRRRERARSLWTRRPRPSVSPSTVRRLIKDASSRRASFAKGHLGPSKRPILSVLTSNEPLPRGASTSAVRQSATKRTGTLTR